MVEGNQQEKDVADGFLCPITCLVMRDPVMLTGDGHTYERVAISQWLSKGNKTSPLTGANLGDNCLLVPNHAVRKAISELHLEVPSEDDIKQFLGKGEKDGEGNRENEVGSGAAKPAIARTYNLNDGLFVFASLRRNLYSLDSTICMWRARQLCDPSAVRESACSVEEGSRLKAQVTCMTALDRLKVVVSGSRDKTLRVWDLPTRDGGASSSGRPSSSNSSPPSEVKHLKASLSLSGHTDWINCVDTNKDEGIVVSGGRDCTLRVWDTMKWKCNHTMRTSDHVNCLAFDKVKNDFFISAGNDWKLFLWDIETLRSAQELSGHTYAIRCCAVDPVSASWFVSGGDDSKLCVWSATSKDCMVEIEGAGGDYNDPILCCGVSSDGHVVACGLENKRIALWDTRTWKLLQKLDGHQGGVQDLCFIPGFGREKLCSVDGRSLRSWSCESTSDWKCQHTVKAHAIACCRMATYD